MKMQTVESVSIANKSSIYERVLHLDHDNALPSLIVLSHHWWLL